MAVFRAWLVGVLSVGLLASCAPAPSPYVPLPSPTCTPEAGGDAYPCTDYQYDQMAAMDKLYSEAEAVYRKFLAEDERILRAGGITKPSPVLLETTTGEYQRWSMGYYRYLRESKATAVGGTYKIVWLKRVPGESMQMSIVALKVCTDTSSITIGAKGEKPERVSVGDETGFFVRDSDGRLKIITSIHTDVKKC